MFIFAVQVANKCPVYRTSFNEKRVLKIYPPLLRDVEWVQCLFLFPLVLGKMFVTCKIGSFLCSVDNLLQKNLIVFFLEIKFQNGAHLKKRAVFDLHVLFKFL